MYRCSGWNKSTKYWVPCRDSSRILITEAPFQCRVVHVGSVVDKVAGTATVSFQDWSILIRLCQRNYIVVATDSVAQWCIKNQYWKLTDYRETTFLIGLVAPRCAVLCFTFFNDKKTMVCGEAERAAEEATHDMLQCNCRNSRGRILGP